MFVHGHCTPVLHTLSHGCPLGIEQYLLLELRMVNAVCILFGPALASYITHQKYPTRLIDICCFIQSVCGCHLSVKML